MSEDGAGQQGSALADSFQQYCLANSITSATNRGRYDPGLPFPEPRFVGDGEKLELCRIKRTGTTKYAY